MTSSFLNDIQGNEIYPGIILYKNIFQLTEDDIKSIISSKDYINDNSKLYHSSKIKNTFFYSLKKINKEQLAKNIQSNILYYLADYCDKYNEAIHTIQWQENIFIDIEYAGDQNFIFNPNKSFIDDETKKIKNTPFSRQIIVEIYLNEDYSGGGLEWIYLNKLKIDKIPSGSILFYPANYLFSKKHDTIIDGRKIVLTTFFNGGKDFLAEKNNIEEEETNFLFSYMR